MRIEIRQNAGTHAIALVFQLLPLCYYYNFVVFVMNEIKKLKCTHVCSIDSIDR